MRDEFIRHDLPVYGVLVPASTGDTQYDDEQRQRAINNFVVAYKTCFGVEEMKWICVPKPDPCGPRVKWLSAAQNTLKRVPGTPAIYVAVTDVAYYGGYPLEETASRPKLKSHTGGGKTTPPRGRLALAK